MKKKSRDRLPASKSETAATSDVLKDAITPYKVQEPVASMVRTQIYLSRPEYEFLQSESRRRDEPMAAVIRSFIEEKMAVPEDVWRTSPLLDEPADPHFAGPEDGAVNHDHYIYGSPKKYEKVDGQWVWKPLPKP